jgi:amino-acid N-acetyltransferase
MDVRTATAQDLPAVTALLADAGLSTVGVDPDTVTLLVAEDAGAVVGAAAVEAHSGHGLLRSVVVDERLRGRALGTELVTAAVARAADSGLTDLWLLTESAEGFFATQGWRRMTAADIPETMQISPEYAARCSDSAAVMVRDLGRR